MNEPPTQPVSSNERRANRRLSVRLPVECQREGEGAQQLVRTVTRNISSGGVYIEMDSPEFQPDDRLRLELTLPPAEGVSPYEGRAACTAEVLRIQRVSDDHPGEVTRYGIAARFLDRMRFSY